jgi:serine/threonine protein kinase
MKGGNGALANGNVLMASITPELPMPEEPEESPTDADAPEEELTPEEEWTEGEDEAQEEEQVEEGEVVSEEEQVEEGAEGEIEEGAEAEMEEGEEPEEQEIEEGPVAEAGPMVVEGDSVLQPCSNCATLLDVDGLAPFAKVHCPICGTAMRVRTKIKNFTLVEVLGSGGMGAVYKALDTTLNRMVALKVVRREFSADAEYVAKFEREARITASVTHPHVVKVYSFGSEGGLVYIAMELVDKGSLDDLMNLQGRVAEIQALNVGIQVAQGLQAAHQKGLIHRDVKPGNILFADAQTAKIVDFGLALLAEHEAEERGEVWGTPYYVAPEKLDHQPEDFRSDIYSLGGTLFHAIAGRPPFEADTASMVALKHLKSKAVSLQAFAPDVSSATAFVINRMLHKDPDKRYQSYPELIEHLEYARAQLQEAVNTPHRGKQRVVVEGAGQKKVMGLITLVLLLMMIGGGVALYIYRDKLFGHSDQDTTSASPQDSGATASQMNARLIQAREQIVAGDPAGALDALQKLDGDSDLAQPFENWITLNEGIASLIQEKWDDARGWFRVLNQRSHFSTDAGDSDLVKFFSNVGQAMIVSGEITPSAGTDYSLNNEEALAPLIYALKDWNMGRFEDAAGLFGLYLSSTPKDPYEWVGDYKPLAQKYVDQEAAYEKLTAAAAAANTTDDRVAVIKQMEDLAGKVDEKLGARLGKLAAGLKEKNVEMDPAHIARMAAERTADAAAISEGERLFAQYGSQLRFAESAQAMQAINVVTADGVVQKDALVKKAGWLAQFKAQLIQDITSFDYPDPLVTIAGGQLPSGPLPPGQKRVAATDTELLIHTPFGEVPCAWTALSPQQILAMADYYIKTTAATAPQQTADREWLAGVYACELGLLHDGQELLVKASQAKDDYKNELSLFVKTE